MKNWIGLLARLVTGGVWVVAGALKLPDPAGSVRAVRAYDLLPEAIVPTVGHLLPIVEVVIGLCLVVGLLIRPMAVLSVLLFAAFIIGIAAAWARGLQIDCGCFGGGGYDADATSKYPWEIGRDVGLMALSLWLVVRPRSRWAVDSLLFDSRAEADLNQPDLNHPDSDHADSNHADSTDTELMHADLNHAERIHDGQEHS